MWTPEGSFDSDSQAPALAGAEHLVWRVLLGLASRLSLPNRFPLSGRSPVGPGFPILLPGASRSFT